MPVTIGKPPAHDFSNPLGMLSDCHRRIETFLQALRRVVREAHGRDLSRTQRKALEAALEYFRESAPKHTLDEEESLFPLLRESVTEPTALQLLDQLHQEHKKADQQHLEVELLGRRWLTEGHLEEESARQMSDTLENLAAMYKTHIEFEDSLIFPLAEKVLSAAEIKAIGCEMAARRGVDLDICTT
jgi:hemerythrin-like domain-containing protein